MTPADDRVPCIDCTNRSHHGYCAHLNCPCACNSGGKLHTAARLPENQVVVRTRGTVWDALALVFSIFIGE